MKIFLNIKLDVEYEFYMYIFIKELVFGLNLEEIVNNM